MRTPTHGWLTWSWLWVMALLLTQLLAACGGGGDHGSEAQSTPAPMEGSATIGPEGGTVVGPDGVTLEVPPGALDRPVTLRIARSAAGAPALPEGLPPDSVVYEITPHELAFNRAVKVRGPRRAAEDGEEGVAFVASAGRAWQSQRALHERGAMTIERASLSYYVWPDWRPLLGNCLRSIRGQDPYPCTFPLVTSSAITATPTGALPDRPGAPKVIAAATLHFDLKLQASRDCVDTELVVDRVRVVNNVPQPRERLLTLPVSLVPGVPNEKWAATTARFDSALTAADNGTATYYFVLSCLRTYYGQRYSGGATFATAVDIPPPPGAPQITQQPVSASVVDGQTATFSVRGTAPDSLVVEWERSSDGGRSWLTQGGGTTLPDGSDWVLTARLADDGALFRAQVCNAVGLQRNCIASATASLTVSAAPTLPLFTTQPVDVTIAAGQTASFTVVASGSPPPYIQWEVAPVGGSFGPVTGEPGCTTTLASPNTTATVATCTITQTPVSASRQRYRALAFNPAAPGGVSSTAATLTINAGALAPTLTQQPLDATTTSSVRSVSFGFAASGSAPITGRWSLDGTDLPQNGPFTVGACSGTAAQGATDLQLSGLSLGCSGAKVRVLVSNGVPPDALSTEAVITIVGTQGALWSTPIQALGFSTAMGIPHAGLALYNGAAVVDGGTLRLLGLGTPFSVPGVIDNIQVVGAGNSNYRAVLYLTDPGGTGACGAGALTALVVYQGSEGDVAVSPPILLQQGVPGNCLTYTAVQSARGFEFVARTVGGAGNLVAGTFDIGYDRNTGQWNAPGVTTQSLALSPECANNPQLYEGALASPRGSVIDPTAMPSRQALLVYGASHPTRGPVLCSTSLVGGSWSAAAVVWSNADPGATPVSPDPVVTMDPRGNALLASVRGVVGGYELALGWLPAASPAWQVEPPLPAYGELLPSTGFAPNGDAVVLYRTKPGAGASYTTVYAARRLAGGAWQPRQRLMGAEGDTRFPRLVMAGNGEALALFQHQTDPTTPFQVQAARYGSGGWGAPQALQPAGSPEGRFAVAAPFYSNMSSGDLSNLVVWWREADPVNVARQRIMSSTLQFLVP